MTSRNPRSNLAVSSSPRMRSLIRLIPERLSVMVPPLATHLLRAHTTHSTYYTLRCDRQKCCSWLRKPHPDESGPPARECPYRRVLCARAASESGSSLRRLGWGKAKGRSPVAWEFRPMIEAGAPITVVIVTVRVSKECAAHRWSSWSHHSRSRATLQGRKAKAALGS